MLAHCAVAARRHRRGLGVRRAVSIVAQADSQADSRQDRSGARQHGHEDGHALGYDNGQCPRPERRHVDGPELAVADTWVLRREAFAIADAGVVSMQFSETCMLTIVQLQSALKGLL